MYRYSLFYNDKVTSALVISECATTVLPVHRR